MIRAAAADDDRLLPVLDAVPIVDEEASPAFVPVMAEAAGEDYSCQPFGGFAQRFQGSGRYRGNMYRFEYEVTLREVRMLLEIEEGLAADLYFSIHCAPSCQGDEFYTRRIPDVAVPTVGLGAPAFYSTGLLHDAADPNRDLIIPAYTDCAIAVSWLATPVKYGRDTLTYPRPFLHGTVLGHVALNIPAPQNDELRLPARTNGVHEMELCFEPVNGACCSQSFVDQGIPTGCREMKESECLGEGFERNFFHGERVRCVETACAFGACCFPCDDEPDDGVEHPWTGTCEPDFAREACFAAGGQAHWRGLGCPADETVLCPPNIGACCFDDGTCTELCQLDCGLAGGVYRGDDTTCDPDNPCQGACCRTGGCENDTPLSCAAHRGIYKGDGTTCATLPPELECGGACCDAFVQDEFTCHPGVPRRSFCTVSEEIVQAVYLGDGWSCPTDDPEDPNDGCVGASTAAGACCLPDGLCINTAFEFCDQPWVNGVFKGTGTSCAADTCAAAACCHGPADCEELMPAECALQGGVLQPAGSSCLDVNNCSNPVQACCFPDGTCQDLTPNTCLSGGGTPGGAGSTCEMTGCDAPTGACCETTVDECAEVTEAECLGSEGVYQGHGTRCATANICPGFGACCRTDGLCRENVTEDYCVNILGGEYLPDGSTCAACIDQRRACCTETGVCLYILEADCLLIGAVPQGPDSICIPGLCAVGACCLDGTCEILPEEECTSLNGDYEGDDTQCEPNLCTLGACCIFDSCFDLTASQCDEAQGQFVLAVSCTPGFCDIGACCVDGDCFNETGAACFADGGVFQGGGSVCFVGVCTLGSCCQRDGSCLDDFLASECQEPDGLFYPGEICATAPPCEGARACCLPDGSCVEDFRPNCEAAGGNFNPGLMCSDAVLCDQPGACCRSGECTNELEADCVAGGGVFLSDTSCTADLCTLGSCCDPAPEYTCTDDLVASQCDGPGQHFRPIQRCAEPPWCDVRGACCFGDGCCVDQVLPAECEAAGGAPTTGSDCASVVCDPTGACCSGGACTQETLAVCEGAGGVYQGDAIECTGSLCGLGACCHLDGTCEDNVVASQCTGPSDEFNTTRDCMNFCIGRGACCLPNDGGCLEGVTQFICEDSGGTYDGDGTTCRAHLCDRGTCCWGENDCSVNTRQECEAGGGSSLAPEVAANCGVCILGSCCRVDATCVDDTFAVECPDPGVFRPGETCDAAACHGKGACCLGDPENEWCERVTGFECIGRGGFYTLDGTECEPGDLCLSGACCGPDGTCVEELRAFCEPDGIYLGEAVDCVLDAVDCTRGACCEMDGLCSADAVPLQCVAPGADFVPDLACDDLSCCPRGACCEGAQCSLKSEGQCQVDGGEYHGLGALCDPSPCQPIGIIASYPLDCAIDARQPFEPTGADPDGWSSVLLTFDGPADGLTPADFTAETVPGGTPVPMASVTPSGNTADVIFDAPIPAGAWTRLTHNTSGTFVTLGYLPADVNADGVSNAQDIVKVIENLDGLVDPPYPEHQCDVDRSDPCAPGDILRVIDLLNGADIYDVWADVGIGLCPE